MGRPMAVADMNEIVIRSLYMRLFVPAVHDEFGDGLYFVPAYDMTTLIVLIERGHAEFVKNGRYRLTEAGLLYWVELNREHLLDSQCDLVVQRCRKILGI